MKLKTSNNNRGLAAFVWAGAMISVPGLIIGGTLVAGMPLWEALLTGFIGYGIIVILMILQEFKVPTYKNLLSKSLLKCLAFKVRKRLFPLF